MKITKLSNKLNMIGNPLENISFNLFKPLLERLLMMFLFYSLQDQG